MTNKTYIIVPALISVLILAFLLIEPKYQDWQKEQTNVRQRERELANAKEVFAEIEVLRRALRDREEIINKIDSALPKDPSVASVFSYFQQRAQGTGVGIRSISLGGVSDSRKKTTTPSIKEIDIDMELGARYPAFKRFLSVIEDSVRLFEISSIAFSSPRDPEEDSFNFKINLKTHGY